MSNGEFEFPKVFPSMRVIARKAPGEEEVAGFVMEAKPDAVSIICFPGRGGPFKIWHARHEDDPWNKAHPGAFEEGDVGVFRVAPSELMLQDILDRLESMEASVADLLSRGSKRKASEAPEPVGADA